jgi:hypothetical protein
MSKVDKTIVTNVNGRNQPSRWQLQRHDRGGGYRP